MNNQVWNHSDSDLLLYATNAGPSNWRAVLKIHAGDGFKIFATGETEMETIDALNVVRQHVYRAWYSTTSADNSDFARNFRAFEHARLKIREAIATLGQKQ